MSGATIIAPMTVAVESATTPAAAMTADSRSRSQNLLSCRFRSGASKNSLLRMRTTSASVMVGIGGSSRHRRGARARGARSGAAL